MPPVSSRILSYVYGAHTRVDVFRGVLRPLEQAISGYYARRTISDRIVANAAPTAAPAAAEYV